MKHVDRMGVMILVAHLIITLAILVLYGIFAYIGQPLTTVENMLLIIVGYWFGAMGKNSLRPNETGTQVQHADKVEVMATETVTKEKEGVNRL